jgi:hypothetical protein
MNPPGHTPGSGSHATHHGTLGDASKPAAHGAAKHAAISPQQRAAMLDQRQQGLSHQRRKGGPLVERPAHAESIDEQQPPSDVPETDPIEPADA